MFQQQATTRAIKPKGARTLVLFFTVVFSPHLFPVSMDDLCESVLLLANTHLHGDIPGLLKF